jgi:non-homologous end joining protein Ku
VSPRRQARNANPAKNTTKAPDEKIPKDMLELASHIVETKAAHFVPQRFKTSTRQLSMS